MNKIYITGDCHSEFFRFSSDNFHEGKELTKDDYVIICGDFGGVWHYEGETNTEKYWLDWLNDKPWTTLFVDGNHENFDRLNAYEVEEWHGGKVHKIRDSIVHLMRGEIFDIAGEKIFAFGGGQSHDIKDGILNPDDDDFEYKYFTLSRNPYSMFRVLGWSWWEQELPNENEIQNARNNLEKENYNVDYIISHEPDFESLSFLNGDGLYTSNILNKFLATIKHECNFKRHYCGHIHLDTDVPATKTTILYEKIVRVKRKEKK